MVGASGKILKTELSVLFEMVFATIRNYANEVCLSFTLIVENMYFNIEKSESSD